MTPEDLRAQHPETYAAIVASAVAAERRRVAHHLSLSDKSGALDLAIECIRSGEEASADLFEKHFARALMRTQQDRRQADSDAAGDALDGALLNDELTRADGAGSGADAVAMELDRMMGGV